MTHKLNFPECPLHPAEMRGAVALAHHAGLAEARMGPQAEYDGGVPLSVKNVATTNCFNTDLVESGRGHHV